MEPGETYGWWVSKPGLPAAGARFSVASGATPSAPSTDTPTILSPLANDVLTQASVTLKFAPLPGYSGPYMVRLHDAHWDGRQAAGFQHDSTLHYLSIVTTSTEITVPVEPGETYSWWVHKPGLRGVATSFTVSPDAVPLPSPDVPTIISPLPNDIVTRTSVTLKFAPLPGYSGPYMVRLHDTHWNGRQAAGFQHDSTLHYLSVVTTNTEITVPVEAGETYSWWVHKPGLRGDCSRPSPSGPMRRGPTFPRCSVHWRMSS